MEFTASLILLTSALAGFISFAWSVVGQFNADGAMDRLRYNSLRLGSVVTWLVGLHAVLTNEAPVWALWLPGLGLNLAALALFWWTSRYSGRRNLRLVFSEVPPEQLFTGGPYNLSRHPFYSAYLLSYLSLTLATQSVPLLACSLTMALIYNIAARKEEAFFLAGDMAAAYRSYMASTGRFLPWPLRPGTGA